MSKMKCSAIKISKYLHMYLTTRDYAEKRYSKGLKLLCACKKVCMLVQYIQILDGTFFAKTFKNMHFWRIFKNNCTFLDSMVKHTIKSMLICV